jgi:hypothetical protein
MVAAKTDLVGTAAESGPSASRIVNAIIGIERYGITLPLQKG